MWCPGWVIEKIRTNTFQRSGIHQIHAVMRKFRLDSEWITRTDCRKMCAAPNGNQPDSNPEAIDAKDGIPPVQVPDMVTTR